MRAPKALRDVTRVGYEIDICRNRICELGQGNQGRWADEFSSAEFK